MSSNMDFPSDYYPITNIIHTYSLRLILLFYGAILDCSNIHTNILYTIFAYFTLIHIPLRLVYISLL